MDHVGGLVVLKYGGYKNNEHVTVSLSPLQARMTADFLHAMADKVDDGEFVEVALASSRDSRIHEEG
jgi:hypothetical protein